MSTRWRRFGCLALLLLLGPCLLEPLDQDGPRLRQEFRAELQAGLTGDALDGRWKRAYPSLDIVVLEASITREEFARRMRRVEGWDRVAVIGPYGSGGDVLPDAAGLNPWLWLRVRCTFGFPQDGIFKALVIANGHVATKLYLENVPSFGWADGWADSSGVIERDP